MKEGENLKKSFSGLNILHKQLSGIGDSKRFFGSFFSGHKYLEINIPYYDYIRAKIFIQDLRDNFEEEVPYQFNEAVLFHILYDDFLNQIKKGAKNEQIANYLLTGKKRYFQQRIQQKRIMKSLTPHAFAFETIEEEIENDKSREDKTASITLRMRESEILRGEVLLHDLFGNEDFEMTVEQLIVIVYLDFIQQVKNEGNSIKVQKSILTHLKTF